MGVFQATVLNFQNICALSIRRHGPLKWSHKYRLVSSATNFPHHGIPLPCHRYVRTRHTVQVVEQIPKHVGTISQNSYPLSHGWHWDFFQNIRHTSWYVLLTIKTFPAPKFIRDLLEEITQDFARPKSVWKITNTVYNCNLSSWSIL